MSQTLFDQERAKPVAVESTGTGELMKKLCCLVVGCVVIFCAMPVLAQEAADDPVEIDAGSAEPTRRFPEVTFEGEVTVTGSLIPRADLTAMSPVTVMEIPTELTYSGTVRIEDLIRTMPQVFAGQNSTIANGATGTASIDLRYLGAERTLVLINGRRMAFGTYSSADLNSIPAPLVKRVDVLTGGASTVYGSDAVAGVVNFIMDTDFTGVRGGLQYSFYNHDNNNLYARELNRAAGFEAPTGMTNDGAAINANIALGGKFADGKGHAVVYLDYRKIDELTKAARDYVHCSINDSIDGPLCGASPVSERGTFGTTNASDPYRRPTGTYTMDWVEDGGDGRSFRPWNGEGFNFSKYIHLQRPDENYNAGAFANYEINEHFDVYMEIMYMNNYTEAQIAPSGNFGRVNRINCDNPMLSPQQHDIICAQGGYADDEYATLYQFRRNVEGGPRYNSLGHTNSRLVAGLRGEINDSWAYDFYGLSANNNVQNAYLNELNIERMSFALDVIEDPDTGEWVCRDPRARGAGCVPWNVFQEGAVTQEAVDYISTRAVGWGKSTTQVVNLTFIGDLEDAGVIVPTATEGLQLAIGAEYREETWRDMKDEVYSTGNLAGFGVDNPSLFGAFNIREIFIEALLPVVQDVRGARDLSIELGYRYSDYSTSGGIDTYKALANWAVSDSWRLRGGYNRAVRAPNFYDLFYQPGFGQGATDSCEGENPDSTFEECARTGVTQAQYGHIPASIFGFSQTLFGGNPELSPEAADTFTVGVVWTPQTITGLSVTLDYYDIQINDAITSISDYYIRRICMETGDSFYCGLIHRDAVGSLWLTDEGYTDTTQQNIGALSAKGIDLNANYLIGLGNAGYLATDLMGSYTLENSLRDPIIDFDCTGYYGLTCGSPLAVWRHRFRATWETNFRLNLSLAWRYLGGVDIDFASPDPNLGDPDEMEYWRNNGSDTIPAYNWFDLAASYTFRSGVRLTLGVNNILDEEPPLIPGLNGDYPTNEYGSYDGLGRYIFSSVQFNF